MKRNNSGESSSNAMWGMGVFFAVFLSIGPLILMVVTSFKLSVDIMSEEWQIFFLPTIANYEAVLCDVLPYEIESVEYCDPNFSRGLWNSLFISLTSSAVILVIGAMAAYALSRFKFLGRGTLSITNMAARMVPPAVLLVPVFGIWTYQFQIDGSQFGIILIYIAMNLPFVIWILQSFIEQVPLQLEEAAYMDGASTLQTFFLVLLPLIKPGLAAAFILTFRPIWNEFLLANALADRNSRTIPMVIVNSITETEIDWGIIMATGMILAIPPIILTLLCSKQIVSGLTAGAVKG